MSHHLHRILPTVLYWNRICVDFFKSFRRTAVRWIWMERKISFQSFWIDMMTAVASLNTAYSKWSNYCKTGIKNRVLLMGLRINSGSWKRGTTVYILTSLLNSSESSMSMYCCVHVSLYSRAYLLKHYNACLNSEPVIWVRNCIMQSPETISGQNHSLKQWLSKFPSRQLIQQ